MYEKELHERKFNVLIVKPGTREPTRAQSRKYGAKSGLMIDDVQHYRWSQE